MRADAAPRGDLSPTHAAGEVPNDPSGTPVDRAVSDAAWPERGDLASSERSVRAAVPVRSPVVLLVDDDDYVRQAVRGILRRTNVRIAEASTAAEALEQWESENPVLALVDLGLPDGDGLDLVAELRARGGDRLGIFVLTGQVPDEDVVRAGGADGLVLKPFRLSELREVVQTNVAARASRVESAVP